MISQIITLSKKDFSPLLNENFFMIIKLIDGVHLTRLKIIELESGNVLKNKKIMKKLSWI